MTTAGFYVILRLIGHAQAGRPVRPDVALKGGLSFQPLSQELADRHSTFSGRTSPEI